MVWPFVKKEEVVESYTPIIGIPDSVEISNKIIPYKYQQIVIDKLIEYFKTNNKGSTI